MVVVTEANGDCSRGEHKILSLFLQIDSVSINANNKEKQNIYHPIFIFICSQFADKAVGRGGVGGVLFYCGGK